MATNFAPNDTQRRIMNTMLSHQLALAESAAQAAEQAKEGLERATEDVNRVARQLEELKAIQKFAAHSFAILSKSRDDLKAAIAQQKLLLHGIRQLPNELLVQIFRTFAKSLPDDYLEESSWRGSLRCLVLMAVCQRWRMVAQSTRELWADIPLFFHRPSRTDISAQVGRLSQGQDIRIMITDIVDDETNPSAVLHSFLTSLAPLDVSITSLFMRFLTPEALPVLDKWSFPAHSVKSLSIQTQTPDEPGVIPPSFLQHFGNVSTLNLCDTILPPAMSLAHIKALNVHSETDTLSPEEMRELCIQLPSLDALCIDPSIDGTIWAGEEHESMAVVESSITELQILLGELESSSFAFRTCIELPRLQTLFCLGISSINPESVDQFINKLVSLRSLHRLCLSLGDDGTLDDEKYSLHALGRLPYIEHIEFEYVDPDVFSRMVANLFDHMDTFRPSDPDAPLLFPKLRRLSFTELPNVPFKEILRLVERRNTFASQYPDKCSKISEVTLEESDWWSKEDYSVLQGLLGPGDVVG